MGEMFKLADWFNCIILLGHFFFSHDLYKADTTFQPVVVTCSLYLNK